MSSTRTTASGNSCRSNRAEKLAAEYGVSVRTIRNSARFADAVDTIAANVGPHTMALILSGRSGWTMKAVVALATLPVADQVAAWDRGPEVFKPTGASKPDTLSRLLRLWAAAHESDRAAFFANVEVSR